MSYAQRKEISGNRTLAIIFVVVIQFALGYAIVTGLAYNVIKKTVQDSKRSTSKSSRRHPRSRRHRPRTCPRCRRRR